MQKFQGKNRIGESVTVTQLLLNRVTNKTVLTVSDNSAKLTLYMAPAR